MGKYTEDVTIIPSVEGEGEELKWKFTLDLDNRSVVASEVAKSPALGELIGRRGYLASDFYEMSKDAIMAASRFNMLIEKQDRGGIKRVVNKDDDGSVNFVRIDYIDKLRHENDTEKPTAG